MSTTVFSLDSAQERIRCHCPVYFRTTVTLINTQIHASAYYYISKAIQNKVMHNRNFDYRVILKNNDISPEVLNHLRKVYGILLACLTSATLGIAAHITLRIGGIFCAIANFAFLFWIICDNNKGDLTRRIFMLCGFGFFNGTVIAPIFEVAFIIDPMIIFAGTLCTVAIFASFSLAALLAKRRSYLYLGGILSSALTMLTIMGLVGLFVPSLTFTLFKVYGGLIVFSGFVIVDTQMIIEVG